VLLHACSGQGIDVRDDGSAVVAVRPRSEEAGAAVDDAGASVTTAGTNALADAGPDGETDGGVERADAGRDAGAQDAGMDTGVAMPAVVPGYVEFDVLTKPVDPEAGFAPRNVLAIWVEDASGMPVEVLGIWAAASGRFLRRFHEQWPDFSFAPWGGDAGVDVITSATAPRHAHRMVRWDLTDAAGRPAPDGGYSVVVEVTDSHVTSAVTSVAFEKGEEPVALSVPETDEFGAITLSYTPPQPTDDEH